MNEERTREMAICILDEFEELLAAKGIKIPSDDREGREEEACLFGTEYYELADAIMDILPEEIGGDRNAVGAAWPTPTQVLAMRTIRARGDTRIRRPLLRRSWSGCPVARRRPRPPPEPDPVARRASLASSTARDR